MLVAIGTIIGAAATVDFWPDLSAAAIGAALGDWLSYWLGYPLPRSDPEHVAAQATIPTLIAQGPRVLRAVRRVGHRHRPLLGPLRASVPIVAGITQMPSWKFQIANWASAFLWAFVLLSPGTFGLKWLLEHCTLSRCGRGADVRTRPRASHDDCGLAP